MEESVLTVDAAALTTVSVYVFVDASSAVTTIVKTLLPTFINVAALGEPDVTPTPFTLTVANPVSATVGVTVRVGVSYAVYGIFTVYEVVPAANGKGVNVPAVVLKAERFALDDGILV